MSSAERLAADAGKTVLIIDKRTAHRRQCLRSLRRCGRAGAQVRPAHLSYQLAATSSNYLSRFTEWRQYQHRVQAWVDGQLLPIPINLETINRLYGLQASRRSSCRRSSRLARSARPSRRPRTSSSARWDESCTRSSSATTPANNGIWTRLSSTRQSPPACRCARINDDRYFTDTYQAMPKHGYTRLFERMLAHPNIKVLLNADYREVQSRSRTER